MRAHEKRGASRAARVARRLARGLGYALLALLGLTILLLACVNLPPVRAFVAARTNAILAQTFTGRLSIESIGAIGWSGVSGVEARAFDAAGKQVIHVQGLSASLPWQRLVWDLLVDKPNPLLIRIDRAAFEHADVTLRDDGSGVPTLAETFVPRGAGKGPPSQQETVLTIETIRIDHAWVHGALGTVPPLDAELWKLAATLRVDSNATSLDVAHVDLKARGLPFVQSGAGRLSGKMQLAHEEGARKAEARFRGRIADVTVLAEAALSDRVVKAMVHAVASPAALTQFAPGLAPRGSTELLAKTHGTLPNLAFEARLRSSGSRIQATGAAKLWPEPEGQVHIQARHFDAAALKSTLPESDIDLDLHAKAGLTSGKLHGSFHLELPPGSLAGQTLPRAEGGGRLSHERGALRVTGWAEVHEPGAPTSLDYELELGSRSWLEASSQTLLTRPARLVALADVSLAGVVETRLRYDLDRERIAGQLNAALPRVVQGRNSVHQLRIKATASGSPEAPRLELEADAESLIALDRRFDRARIRVAELELTPSLSLKGCDLALSRRTTTLNAHLAELTIGDGLRVEGFALESAGRAWVSLAWNNGLERLDARAKDIDLQRLSEGLGLDTAIEQGKLDFTVNIDRRQGKPNGSLRGSIRELDVGAVDEGHVDLRLDIRDGYLSGAMVADLVRGGSAALTLEQVPLLKPPYNAKTLQRLTGRISLKGDLELSALDRLLVNERLPFERASGRVTLDAALDRVTSGDALPEVTARLQTRRLELVGKRQPLPPQPTAQQARQAAPLQVRKLDLDAELRLESDTGKAAINARGKNDRGELFRLRAQTELPRALSKALAVPVLDLPLEAGLVVPPHALDGLGDVPGLSGSEGHVSLELEFQGTPRNPEFELKGRVEGLRPLEAPTDPLDLEYHARLRRDGGTISADAFILGERVGQLRATWEGDLMRLPEATLEYSPVMGSAMIVLHEFPLAAVPGSSMRQVTGSVSGQLTLEDFGRDARLNGYLQARPLLLGEARFKELFARFSMGDRKLQTAVRVEQADGRAQAVLAGGYSWGARPLPQIEMPLEARLSAKALSLAGLALFASEAVNEIDGRVNAELVGRFGGGEPSLQGSLELRDGVLQEPITGQRFHDIDAKVKLVAGQVRVEELTARGSTGRLRATGSAHLHGLRLHSAEAHVRISEKEKIPITYEGVSFGDAYGKVDATLRVAEGAGTEIRINVPELTLELPESAGAEPQPLEPAEYIRIGTRQSDGELVTLPLQPLAEATEPREPGPPTVILVKVASKARIQRGTMLDVGFKGDTRIELAEELAVSGQIDLTGGKLDIQGKLFDVERGVITFDGPEPSNPTVVATARWDSPADYRVTAEYTGTAREGQLTLSAEPALTDNEIMSLIMFGSPDGNMGGSSNTVAGAFGVAGGTAIRGVNRVINRVTKLDIDARVDTSTGSARPEIVLQLSPRLSARVTRSLGEPAPGQPPDRTFATLDLRLGGRWSLATTVGDRGGSAMDLIWRHRY